jgi:signal transduction histidine kinase/ActR/RegA family two-component response regulator
MEYLPLILVYAGSALMLLNIVRYIMLERVVLRSNYWDKGRGPLHIPLALLILFLLGYLAVGYVGTSDNVVPSILFGGSLFVFLILSLMKIVLKKVDEGEERIGAVHKDLKAEKKEHEAKSAFLSNIGHDIRTPMNVIMGCIALCKKEDASLPEIRENVAKIERACQHLLSLVNDVLEMSRIESGKIETEETTLDLREIVAEWQEIFAPQMQEKNIDFIVDCNDVKDPLVTCSRQGFNRVVMNLLSNACKFTPDGGTVSLKLSEIPSDREGFGLYELRVKDNGIGMTESLVSRLFDAFEMERSSSLSGVQGVGLGMAITKRIVDQMDGKIQVQSQSGKGTEFVVTLPMRLQSAMQTQWGTDLPNCPVNFAGKRVLLVEDMPVNREVTALILKNMGFEVEFAANGEEAVYKLSSAHPGYYHVVLMDIQMPVMDGYEATRRIRLLSNVEQAYVPIVAMTANAFSGDMEKAMEVGMNGYVAKPIDVAVLEKTLAGIFGKKV